VSVGYEQTIIAAVITAIDAISVQGGDNVTIRSVKEYDRFTADDGERPSVSVEWLGESSTQSGTELNTELRLRLDARLDYQQFSGIETSRQNRLMKHDIVKALTNIDYAVNDAFLRSIASTPSHEEDPEEPAEGVAFLVVFAYATDFKSPQTATAPLS